MDTGNGRVRGVGEVSGEAQDEFFESPQDADPAADPPDPVSRPAPHDQRADDGEGDREDRGQDEVLLRRAYLRRQMGVGGTAEVRSRAAQGNRRHGQRPPQPDPDVLLDRFAMCHTIDLRDRFGIDPVTIPPADLVLTKLQVVRMNQKDLLDLTALLADHLLGGEETGSIDLGRLTALLGKDWGFEHTARLNLARLRTSVAGFGLPEAVSGTVGERIAGILAALDKGTKSLGWQLRARIGERVQWYEMPEDVRR